MIAVEVSTPHPGPTRVVLGTAPLAGLYTPVPAAAARATLRAAWARGLRRFDTAPHYGVGRAERRLGAFLEEEGAAGAGVSTKVGRTIVRDPEARPGAFAGTGSLRSTFDFTPRAVRRQLAGSLRRLRVDRVETVFLHDPDDHLDEAVAAIGELQRLRADGLLARIGVGTNRAETALALLDRADLDVVMIAGRLTLLDVSAADRLLPRCAERGTSLWAAGLFNGGILADPRDGAFHDYRPASPGMLAIARRMAEACARHGVRLRDAALRLPDRYGQVDAVVIGVRSPAELDEALGGLTTPIPTALWSELDEIRAGISDM